MSFRRLLYYGPQNDYMHSFVIRELISQLHRTSVTHRFLVGIILCNSGTYEGTFCECANYTRIIFELHTHLLHKRFVSELLCNHFGPQSSAIGGDTISRDASFSTIGFRGKFFLRCPPPRPVFGLRSAIFAERSGGVAAIACETRENAVRQG